jgi:hypothetical protein
LQKRLGGRRRGCGGATWPTAIGWADAGLTQCRGPARWTRSISPPWTDQRGEAGGERPARGGGSPEEGQRWPPDHQTRRGRYQNEEEGARNPPRGLKRRERRRRRRSGRRSCGGAPVAAELRLGRGKRRGEGCGRCRGVMLPLYRVEEEGEEARKAVGGGARRGRRRSSPGHHRRRRLEATGHRLRHGLDREHEEDSAKLTSCSMTAMGRCRRRAAMRGDRDHGCPLGRGLRPRLRAFEGGDGVLGVLRCECKGEEGG